MRDYRHFVTIGVLLLCLLAIGIAASLQVVPEANKIIIAALAGFALLIKAWVEKARGHKDSWFRILLDEAKAIAHARSEWAKPAETNVRDEGSSSQTKQKF